MFRCLQVFRFHDPPVLGWVRAPPKLHNRLLEGLRDYMGTAAVHGREMISWRHEIFREICVERYLPTPADVRAAHEEIARLHLADGPVRRTITLSNIKRTKVRGLRSGPRLNCVRTTLELRQHHV